MPTPSIYPRLDTITARQRELSQAQARPARIRFHVDVNGLGESRAKIKFATMILEEPTFSYGAYVRSNVRRGEVPVLSACVLDYDTNDQNMFIGAEMGMVVDWGSDDIRVTFNFTFEGVALRAMNRAMR